jgi:hypothetical protein
MHARPLIWNFIFLFSALRALGQQQDISIDHIEFVQVAQDRDNNVLLVAGKSTVARVFLRSIGAGARDITSGISGSLTADGLPETLRPFGDLSAIAPAGPPDPTNQRHSLNFLLPMAWTRPAGALQIRAAVKLSSGPEKLQTVSAAFQVAPDWPAVFRVFHLEVCAPDADGKRKCAANLGDVSELMQKIYPVPDGAIEYNPVATGFIEWPAKLGFLANDSDDVRKAAYLQQVQFTRFLMAYYFLLEQPVDQLFAWIPNLDGAPGLQSFATARTGAPGHVWWTITRCSLDPCGAGDRQNNGAEMARYVAYNLGLPDPDFARADTFQALFNTRAIAPPAGESIEYLIIGGTLTPDGSVAQLAPGYRVTSALPGAPSDPAGTHCLRFSGGASADYCFSPFFLDSADSQGIGGFEIKAPLPAGATRVALLRRDSGGGERELTSLTASADAPALSILVPQAGVTWQGRRTIEWTASDPDGNPLMYALQYSADNGVSWTPLAIDMKDTRYEVDGTRIWGGSHVLFRVFASNGLNTTSAVVGPITVTQSPKLTLDQTALDFLNVTVGQIAERTLLLSNTGSGPVTAGGQIPAGSYSLLFGGGNLVIPAEGQRAITVRWTPTSTGSQQGTLALSSTDPSLAGMDVPLSGVAFDTLVPAIRLGSSSLNFDSVNSGQTKDLKLTIGNAGAATLTVSSLTSSNPRFSVSAPSLPMTILAGRSADVTVRFSPNASGGVSGTLSIASNDPARSAVTVTLTGTGAAGPAPTISLAPASLDFGAISTGQIKDLKLSIGNTGAADLVVRSILSSSSDFTFISSALPVTVVPGRTTDITVRFAPSAGGPASASLTIASNDSARPNLAISMTGSGLTPVVSTVLGAIAYHEITALTTPLDTYNMPAISRGGNRAIFTVRSTDLWAINTDGSGLLKVDTDMHPNARFFSISDDGAKALIWNETFLRAVNTDGSGGNTVLTSANGAVQAARLSGDGKTIVFVNGSGAGSLTVNGNTRIVQRGIWSINSDGTGLRGIVSGLDAAGLLGIGDISRVGSDSQFPGGVDVSFNGSRVVFGVDAGAKGRVALVVNGDGSGLRVIRAGLSRLFATAISGDGSTVAYTGAAELGVARFDGSGGLAQAAPSGLYSLQVSNDGSLVFAGSAGNGLLYRTDGSRLVELFAPLLGSQTQLAYENAAVNRATMNGDGTRFLFTTPGQRYAQNGIIELATAEINPSSLGAAPSIVNPTVDPASIPGDGAGYRAIITAKVTSSSPVASATAQSFLQGVPDVAGTTMTDTGGGVWAGSLFFSTGASGPRVLRVKAETQSPDGKRHATAIDFGGFAIR